MMQLECCKFRVIFLMSLGKVVLLEHAEEEQFENCILKRGQSVVTESGKTKTVAREATTLRQKREGGDVTGARNTIVHNR